jgi:lysophospholipase L1-like esterase
MARLRSAAVVPAFAASLVGLGAPAAPAVGTGWSASWATSQEGDMAAGPWPAGGETLRMVARTAVGGTQLRIDLANPFAASPATLQHVTVGIQQNGGTTTATPVTALFGGSQSVAVSAGGSVTSDPVAFPVTAGTRLLISIYVPSTATMTEVPFHAYAIETEFNHNGSDASTAQSFPVSNEFTFSWFLSGVQVDATAPQAVVAIGDSITDGISTQQDSDTRWPNYLAQRAGPSGLAVVNEGFSSDNVIADQPNLPSVTTRWTRDVLQVPGVRTVIEAGGINDLRTGKSAAQLEAAQQSLIASAHAAGVRVLLATLTPCGGDPPGACTLAFDAQRAAYNAWVRGGGSGADGFADFDAALGGYSSGGVQILNPMYDPGDHIHPNAAGGAVMADMVPVGAL